MGTARALHNQQHRGNPVRRTVNKKLATMSKESKEGKKNRKRTLKPPKDEVKLPNINPMYLFTGIGLIIAALSLYYTQRTAMKEGEEENEKIEEARVKVEEEKKRQHKATRPHAKQGGVSDTHGIKGPDHVEPFYAKRHENTGIFTFNN